MRMWMIDPSLLCRKHLLGEHNEIHKHRHNFEKHHSVTGRIYPIVLIDLESNGTIVKDVLLGQMDKSKYSDVNVFINDVLENFKA